ncbi:hypothetical protein B0H14DRAFT_3457250 [Mycena olivaceomarginata]|nr:hypothetical protein B0H14DRAFT_3457250 [Mycena olivaceomarginata]
MARELETEPPDMSPHRSYTRDITMEDIEWMKRHIKEHGLDTAVGVDSFSYQDCLDIPNEKLLELFYTVSTSQISAVLVDLPSVTVGFERAPKTWGAIPKSQNGFQADLRTNDSAFVPLCLIDKAEALNKPLYVAYLDLKNPTWANATKACGELPALFAGVVTTFVAQTSQALSPDNTAITNSLLGELIALQRAQANGTSLDSIPPADTSFTADPTDILVNGLWFTGLALSLATALLAWGARKLIGFLPYLLHVSLFLFLLGLVIFLLGLSSLIAFVEDGITAVLIGAYAITLICPILTIKCPYRTPLSGLLSLPTAATVTVTALSWLARHTSDPSATAVLAEALGVEDAPPLDRYLLYPAFIQQWASTRPRLIAGEPGTLGDDMALGRLIRASVSLPVVHHMRDATGDSPSLETISIMLNHLSPVTPISVTDPATVLSLAACRRTSRFAWGDQEELAVPKWMWWSILTHAAVGPQEPTPERDGDEADRLFQICVAGSKNIDDYQLRPWLEDHVLPTDLRRAITEWDVRSTLPLFSPFAALDRWQIVGFPYYRPAGNQ